jgi:hypothetical protein
MEKSHKFCKICQIRVKSGQKICSECKKSQKDARRLEQFQKITQKVCKNCNKELSIANFDRQKYQNIYRYYPYCKECRKQSRLEKREMILKNKDNTCEQCGFNTHPQILSARESVLCPNCIQINRLGLSKL